MAQTGYASAQAPIRTDRGTEYEAFARTTGALKSAKVKDSFPALAEALHENRRLWTLLATSVADKDNQLPQQLRAQLFYLAEFTLQHTDKVLNKTADVDVLIEINTSIMKGLRAQAQPA